MTTERCQCSVKMFEILEIVNTQLEAGPLYYLYILSWHKREVLNQAYSKKIKIRISKTLFKVIKLPFLLKKGEKTCGAQNLVGYCRRNALEQVAICIKI